MSWINQKTGLYTDYYELSMAEGYYFSNKKDQKSVFDYFFRSNPFKGGFVVFAGLQDLLDLLVNFKFGNKDIKFLKSLGFKSDFLEFLHQFRFKGNILSVREGEIIFPNEPVLVVEGTLIECQLIESLLLNILNFETLIATKSFRIKQVCGNRKFAEFGLRRAQGFGSVHASRAAVIGGASSTSNVFAAKTYGLPVSGTQAHSWIQSFDNELDAFREYANSNPENTVLLVDTYNTLLSGVPNAIKTGKELEAKGFRLKAIRLDSGDLAYLSKKARKMLNDAGLNYVEIIASNQLNENVIKSLIDDQNAEIDAFGVGTELITGKTDAALDGVYKLSEIDGNPKMKYSENVEKRTLPGQKKLIRYFDHDGKFYRDAILLKDEKPETTELIYHPVYPDKNTLLTGLKSESLLSEVLVEGEIKTGKISPQNIHKYLASRISMLPDEHKRFISPHLYKVGISKKLMDLRDELTRNTKLNY